MSEMTITRIKRMRAMAGLPMRDFARIVGVRRECVSRWERGVYTPGPLACKSLERVERIIEQCQREEPEPAPAYLERLLRALA